MKKEIKYLTNPVSLWDWCCELWWAFLLIHMCICISNMPLLITIITPEPVVDKGPEGQWFLNSHGDGTTTSCGCTCCVNCYDWVHTTSQYSVLWVTPYQLIPSLASKQALLQSPGYCRWSFRVIFLSTKLISGALVCTAVYTDPHEMYHWAVIVVSVLSRRCLSSFVALYALIRLVNGLSHW